jgi:hypothetical protein
VARGARGHGGERWRWHRDPSSTIVDARAALGRNLDHSSPHPLQAFLCAQKVALERADAGVVLIGRAIDTLELPRFTGRDARGACAPTE